MIIQSSKSMVLQAFLILIIWGATAQNREAKIIYEQKLQQGVTQQICQDYQKLKPYFDEAYQRYPTMPKGVLEAVSYTYTRFHVPEADTLELDPEVMPKVFGPMGLTLHGKGVFRENLRLVAELSNEEESVLVESPRLSILAYAKAFAKLQDKYGCFGDSLALYVPILMDLSELPARGYAMNSSLYAIYKFFTGEIASLLDIGPIVVELEALFGDQLRILQSSCVSVVDTCPRIANVLNADYEEAIWKPAAQCNYTSGRSLTPSNIVIHYTSGTYAGSIAWFQNCNARASAHYLIRSFDGQVTQMVREADKAWHVGSENSYTIGIEHEAYGNVYSFFTPIMYQSSANLVRDICSRYPAINPLRMFFRDTLDNGTVLNYGVHSLGGRTSCTQIRGHQHYPNQTHTDPGPYWNWNYYYQLVNPAANVELTSEWSGDFTDIGGASAGYGNDERRLFLIHLPGADSIVLDFTSFNLEPDYDFMWIYAGATPFDPLVGRWNTQSPGRISVAGEDLLVEFRSDCRTTAAGWQAHWQGVQSVALEDASNPSTTILWDEQTWMTHDTILSFLDEDDGIVDKRFYQILEFDGSKWKANPDNGFFYDDFNVLDTAMWLHANAWTVQSQSCRNMHRNGNCYLNTRCDCGNTESTLFEFKLDFLEGDRASFVFNANLWVNGQTGLNAYQIIFDREQGEVVVEKRTSGAVVELMRIDQVDLVTMPGTLYRVIWDKQAGTITVFQNQVRLGKVTDHAPLSEISNVIAFVTENALVALSELRVYASRLMQLQLTVGTDKLICQQAVEGQAYCKVVTLVIDGAGKFSSVEEKLLKVDFTPPSTPEWVHDGLGADQSRFVSPSGVCANWGTSVDNNSGPVSYECSIFTAHNNMSRTYKVIVHYRAYLSWPIRLAPGETFVKVSVVAKNGAGLCSDTVVSSGAIYENPLFSSVRKYEVAPNPTSEYVQIVESTMFESESQEQDCYKVRCVLYDLSGRVIKESVLDSSYKFSLEGFRPGIYLLKIVSGRTVIQVDKLVKY